MSRRRKLEKFEALNHMPHVFQNYSYDNPALINSEGEKAKLAGRWNMEYFKKEAPLVVELACGRGEYALGLAELYPDRHYIGVDIKGARIWKGASLALERELQQVAFIRSKIECIDHFFGTGEIDEIWIIFPDPFLKAGKSNRRLTSPVFLDRYKKILSSEGRIKLKTDSPELFEFTMEVLKADTRIEITQVLEDVHHIEHDIPALNIITYYEKMHIADGRKINYIEFKYK